MRLDELYQHLIKTKSINQESDLEDRSRDAKLQLLIQLFYSGIEQVMTRQPIDPYRYLAEYLRKQSRSPSVEPEDMQQQHEYEIKKILLTTTFLTTQQEYKKQQKILAKALALEEELILTPEESEITGDHHELMNATIKDTHYLDSCCPHREPLQPLDTKYIATNKQLIRNFGYGNAERVKEAILPCVIDCIVELLKEPREMPILWASNYIRHKSPQTKHEKEELQGLQTQLDRISSKAKHMNYRLEEERSKTEALLKRCEDLTAAIDQRNKAIEQITVTHLMDCADKVENSAKPKKSHNKKYHYVIINEEKKQILRKNMLVISLMLPKDIIAFRRAEQLTMYRDETQHKATIEYMLHYEAAVMLQKNLLMLVKSRLYRRLLVRRTEAANYIQEKYRERLYFIATQLPEWCVVGGEVIIANTCARKAAMTFHFYEGKDFPAGNYHIETNRTLDHLKSICRNDERCVGFATNGSLKRFIPRQLSQLVSIEDKDTGAFNVKPGLFIKVCPDPSEIVTSGILMEVPSTRLDDAKVAYDGIGLIDFVPVGRLSARWTKGYDLNALCDYYQDRLNDTTLFLPPKIYSEPHDRFAEVHRRKVEYQVVLDELYQKKVVKSAIRLQSAWRARKAREEFAQTLKLRAKEQERALLVEQTAQKSRPKVKYFSFRRR